MLCRTALTTTFLSILSTGWLVGAAQPLAQPPQVPPSPRLVLTPSPLAPSSLLPLSLAQTLLAPATLTASMEPHASLAQAPEHSPPSEAIAEPDEFSAETPIEPAETPVPPASAQTSQTTPVAEPVSLAWPTFTDETGAFIIALPGEPVAYNLELATSASAVAEAEGTPSPPKAMSQMYVQMQLLNPSHLEIYAVASVDVADLIEGNEDPMALLDGCVGSLSARSPLTPPRALTLGTVPGVEAEFQLSEDSFQVARCYLSSNHAYLLTVTRELFAPEGKLTPVLPAETAGGRSPSMDFFFNSFEIMP